MTIIDQRVLSRPLNASAYDWKELQEEETSVLDPAIAAVVSVVCISLFYLLLFLARKLWITAHRKDDEVTVVTEVHGSEEWHVTENGTVIDEESEEGDGSAVLDEV
jgi:hypothetical protein